MKLILYYNFVYSKWKKNINSSFKCEQGVAAVEFALIAPILILILIATIELASVISTRMAVNSSVSSVTNSVLLSGNKSPSEASILDYAQQIKKQRGVAEVKINLNQAHMIVIDSTGASSSEGVSSILCYCPVRQENQINWGGPVECNSECTNESRAGKFMSVHVKFAPPILFGRLFEKNFLGEIYAVVRVN